jgi:hypothetical protein
LTSTRFRERHHASIIEFEKLQLREGPQTAEDACQCVDVGVYVLHARVR